MVEGQIDNMVQDTARRMESQGLNMDLYMKYTGMTMEQMREQMKPQALKRIQTRLVLEEVVKAENLQVSDERLDEEIAKMAQMISGEGGGCSGGCDNCGGDCKDGNCEGGCEGGCNK